MVRGALKALLELETDLQVVADVSRGDEVVARARDARAEVAILDIDLPGIDGLTAAAELRREVPDCRIVILTGMTRPSTLRRALQVGVDGFLVKDTPAERLAAAVRDVVAGRRVVDGNVALLALESEACPLTDRELEVLRLAARGDNAVEIASVLYLSPGTVRNYLTEITVKVNARNRVDAIRIATENDWL